MFIIVHTSKKQVIISFIKQTLCLKNICGCKFFKEVRLTLTYGFLELSDILASFWDHEERRKTQLILC